jgi:uncharacterized protein (TIGR02391 family)
MERLRSHFATAAELLALSAEDLAPLLLRVARDQQQLGGGMFWPEPAMLVGLGGIEDGSGYPSHTKQPVERLVQETLDVLQRDGLITKAGEEAVRSRDAYERWKAAKAFPKALLHPVFADRVWSFLLRGEFDEAVFTAFKAVEESVRAAGGFEAKDIGVELMRKAFQPERGPLTKLSDPLAEREALMHLFAGAIGSYKNPHSHRTVNLSDPREAQEQVMLATHLLRIVDARKSRP